MDTYFLSTYMSSGYDKVKRATRNEDIFSYEIVFFPIHLSKFKFNAKAKNNHWALAVVNLEKRNVSFYDSFYSTDRTEYMLKIVDYLEHEYMEKGCPYPLDTSTFTLQHVKDIPKQQNGSDCGVFICQYSEFLSRNATFNFTYKDMKYFRKRMIYEIVHGSILAPGEVMPQEVLPQDIVPQEVMSHEVVSQEDLSYESMSHSQEGVSHFCNSCDFKANSSGAMVDHALMFKHF